MTYHDLRSIDCFRNKTVMAIKAPPNTQLSVPRTDKNEEKFSIQMKSETGEIDVFLCPENLPPSKPKQVPPMDMLLRDIKLSPAGLFDLTTPPVPQLDSPTPRPISTDVSHIMIILIKIQDFTEIRSIFRFSYNGNIILSNTKSRNVAFPIR